MAKTNDTSTILTFASFLVPPRPAENVRGLARACKGSDQ